MNQQVAAQFLQEAARVGKASASTKLVSAFNDCNCGVAEAAARPENQQNPQRMRNTVQSGLNDLNKAMARYELGMAQSRVLDYTQTTIEKWATSFLPKNDKSTKKRAS